MQQFRNSNARLVQMGLAIPGRALQKHRNLVVFVSPDIVENENLSVPIWQVLNGPAQIHLVKNSAKPKVRSAKFYQGPGVFLVGFKRLVERHFRISFLAKLHKHSVESEPAQPGTAS